MMLSSLLSTFQSLGAASIPENCVLKRPSAGHEGIYTLLEGKLG